MAKYPFLPQARQHVAKSELEFRAIVELPSIRNRAKERVSASFSLASRLSNKRLNDLEIEVASFPLAIMYVAGTGDPTLAERFALFEAQQINRYLKEETRDALILEIANAFKWSFKPSKDKTHTVFIHFVKYLENASRGRLSHDPKWKLVNRMVDDGWVQVTPFQLARLLQEEVKKRIEDSTKQELGEVPQDIQKDIEELKTAFLKMKPHLEEFDQVVAKASEYPPCITALLKRATTGQHLSHTERFGLVTYMLHQGISVDSVVNLFSNVADFKEAKTRYQVENLAGVSGGRTHPYITQNCSTLQTHGVCPKPNDAICKSIRNPLTYHLRKQVQVQKQPNKISD